MLILISMNADSCSNHKPSILQSSENELNLSINTFTVIFEVLTVVIMKSTIFWDVMPYSKLEVHKWFGEIYCLHLKDQRVNQASNKQAASSLNFLLTDWYTWSAATWCSLPLARTSLAQQWNIYFFSDFHMTVQIFHHGQKLLWHICSRQELWSHKRQQLLGNRFITCNNGVTGKRCSLHSLCGSYMTQQKKNCWERCYLCGPCRGYLTRNSCDYKRVLRWQFEE
jgi:hypothetical protein